MQQSCITGCPLTPSQSLERLTSTGTREVKLHIEFHAATASDGTIQGETTFGDQSEIQRSDTPEANLKEVEPKRLSLKAEFDCLAVEGNKAVMGGTVTEATWQRYIGRKVLVVAEENEGSSRPSKQDKVTWGIYRAPVADQITSDAERPDELSGRTWLATDAERAEDGGVLSNQNRSLLVILSPCRHSLLSTAKKQRGRFTFTAKLWPEEFVGSPAFQKARLYILSLTLAN